MARLIICVTAEEIIAQVKASHCRGKKGVKTLLVEMRKEEQGYL